MEEIERLTRLMETAFEEVAQQLKNPRGAEDLHVYIMERFDKAKQYKALLAEIVGEQEAERVRFVKFDAAFKKIEEPDARNTSITRTSTREEG